MHHDRLGQRQRKSVPESVRREVNLDYPTVRDDDPFVDGVQQLGSCLISRSTLPELRDVFEERDRAGGIDSRVFDPSRLDLSQLSHAR